MICAAHTDTPTHLLELRDGALDGSVHGAVLRPELPGESGGGAHQHGEKE
jgi:hypothetical protein